MHVHCHNALLRLRQIDDLVRLGNVQAHRLFGEDMCPGLERGQNDLGMQWVWRGHGHDVEVGKVTQDFQPRLRTGKHFRGVACPELEVLTGAPGGLWGPRRHRHELELDGRQLPRPTVQSNSSELGTDAAALQVRVGPRMYIAAKHAGADECDFDCGFHRKAGQAGGLSLALLRRMCSVDCEDATTFSAECAVCLAECRVRSHPGRDFRL